MKRSEEEKFLRNILDTFITFPASSVTKSVTERVNIIIVYKSEVL